MTWEFLHRWYMPFVWITLSSLISVPIAIYTQNGMTLQPGSEIGLSYGSSWVPRDDFLASIVIYVLNLGAAIWFFTGDGSTRWAAFWATLLGLSRIVAPVALASMAAVPIGTNQHFIDWHTLRVIIWFQDAQMFALGIMLWAAFARFVGESEGLMGHGAYYAEA